MNRQSYADLFSRKHIPTCGGNPAVKYRGDNNAVTSPSMYRMLQIGNRGDQVDGYRDHD